MGGDQAGGLALAIFCIMSVLIVGPAVVSFLLSRSLAKRNIIPRWFTWCSIPIGLLLGYYITYFQVFSDLGEAKVNAWRAPNIIVTIPEDYSGFVTVFFDSTREPLTPDGDGQYRLQVSDTGVLVAGSFPDIETLLHHTELQLQFPDNKKADVSYLGATGGGISSTVRFLRVFAGSSTQIDEILKEDPDGERILTPEEVYLNLRNKPE